MPILPRTGPSGTRGETGVLIRDVEASGLTGRGGAAFPVHRKLAVVARAKGTRKVVVANGWRASRPAARTSCCCGCAPHLVLDGLQLAAEATGATEAHPVPAHRPRPAGSCARWPNGLPAAWTAWP